MSQQLDALLSKMYRAHELGQLPPERVTSLARTSVAQDQALRKEVLDKTRELESVVKSRHGTAFVEERQLDYLRLMV